MNIEIENLMFRYEADRFELTINDLTIDTQQPTAIIGPSGSGKTTLLRLITGILRPTRGSMRVLGRNLSDMTDKQARAFRITNVGLVFQDFELIDYLDARDNILLPFRITHELTLNADARTRAEELAEATGIAHLLRARPNELSQGERQRVAICRALVTKPGLLLADEPTGSLDPENQKKIVDLLHMTAKHSGAGLVMVTHDHELLDDFDRVIHLPELRECQG